ncbi:Chitobiosyldiphosphodolichol beta-mannosyltransferase-like protein [Emericellopsis cladophorae]|uniref:Chitobiosyldiphosphodolichol beta-mannosyltransferase n=1 Tax=Emericellopsis cladophorae TaxID=2686198 RepID=A0A9P9Y4F2_9HYPO|nr:Chitobiosyldiphosphodolichol beta-mannosyltransferase-like protein [Emericellopsis cladophorae]KAI6783433.1 Chitobiosyldiphosphodolichol beta-mannosyltransferase-like protein [Emericellopsis cladophorae]
MWGSFLLSMLAGAFTIIFLAFFVRFTFWAAKRSRHAIPSRYVPAAKPEDEHIQILVLGDIGRSPRMQYHAISVAKHGIHVDLIGYKETARHPELIGKENVSLYALSPYPEWIAWGTLPLLSIPYKVIHQFCTLYYQMMYAAPAAQWIIIQNPPSIPTFHVAMFVAWVRGSKVIVDWHNYGHTLLSTTLLLRPLVPIYRWYEKGFGRRLGNANLAVTDAMCRQLKGPSFKVETPVVTLHDRPAAVFQPITDPKERFAVLSRIGETKKDATNIIDGTVRLIVSSTSWTADEDFGILLDALMAYAAPAVHGTSTTDNPAPILAIITGKGPQKQPYIDTIKELESQGKLPGVRILTAWLSTRDYAALLACADLGVSLHKSSSGVDLPMKVVDMFGAGLPVAAYSAFESFGELIKEDVNGCGFETAPQLTEVFQRLLGVDGVKELARLKKGAISEGSLRWDEEWDRVVGRIIGVVDSCIPAGGQTQLY